MSQTPSASDVVASRVQELRKRLGLTAKQLAERCGLMGAPGMTASVIANIESGRRDASGQRRRQITLEEWLILAQALHVAPIHLLVPVDDERARYALTPEEPQPTHGLRRESAGQVRAWIKGEKPLRFTNERVYGAEAPASEWASRRQSWDMSYVEPWSMEIAVDEVLAAMVDKGYITPPKDQESEGGEAESNG